MLKLNIQHFAAGENVHTTAGMAANSTGVVTPYGENGLSPQMKTYYSDYLIDIAEPKLVHDQFGQKHPIPKNSGKTIEFRKYDPLPTLTEALTDGVTPNGQKISQKTVTAEVKQYGGYTELSDMLLMTAIDNNLVAATKLLGGQAGRTLDSITREVLAGGTNVQFAEGQVETRDALKVGEHLLTIDAVRKAVRTLKRQNAETINGTFVGIIHPDVAYDLMSDPKWINVKTYSDPEGIYNGEIGKIENVRFVETGEAKIFEGEGAVGANEKRANVYATTIIADEAYGTTDIAGGGLQHIVKQLGSAGTSDPLNQRATAGWKATKAAVRLVEQYMVRIETASSFEE